MCGDALSGAGGATKAFKHAEDRRIKEIEGILGFEPYPGSLNVRLDDPFNWDHAYYPGHILDVKDRAKGLESPWYRRKVRFYPLGVRRLHQGKDSFPPLTKAYGMRFDGEHYPEDFLELVSPIRLRNKLATPHEDVFPVEIYR